jgi:Family of unknown function (DUF6353)
MSLTVPASITSKLGRNVLLLQKSSPTLLFGVGIVGVVGGTVLACRATLKMNTILDDAAKKMTKVKEYDDSDYSEKDREHDLTLVRFQTGIQVAKVYVPAITVSVIGIVALTGSHRILTNRNAALTAAYATLDQAFNRYRQRVIEKYGEDQDRDFRFDTELVQITDPDTNKKKTVARIGPGEISGYARFFDPFSPSWSKDPQVNLFFLKCQQNHVNDLLKVRGHVFLNEVYDRLGMERSSAGAVVGWVLSKDGSTDNHISFGVFEGQTENSREFVNGREGAVLCDFNVDGLIYDKIDKIGESFYGR